MYVVPEEAQKRWWDPLELELQAVKSCLWVLELNLGTLQAGQTFSLSKHPGEILVAD